MGDRFANIIQLVRAVAPESIGNLNPPAGGSDQIAKYGGLQLISGRYVSLKLARNTMTKDSSVSKKTKNSEVAVVFTSYPQKIRTKLLFLRQLILETAASTEGVGEIEETLKWGEPSYLTPKTKSGSTIRIDWKKSQKEQYAMYFKCAANLVVAFRERYPKEFRFGGNRSILFNIEEKIPVKELKNCIALALTYHLNKKLETAARWEMVEKSHKP